MPISVLLTGEDGEELERLDDAADVLSRLLPSVEDSSYKYLRYIDPYADTVFNQLQMDPFLAEWKKLEATARDEDCQFLTRISELARHCQREPHLYLKFEGD